MDAARIRCSRLDGLIFKAFPRDVMAALRMASSLLNDNCSPAGPPAQPIRIGTAIGRVVHHVGNFSPRAWKKLKFSRPRSSQNGVLKYRMAFTTCPMIISFAAAL